MDAPNEMPSLLRYFWLGLYVVFIVCVFVCLKFVGLIVLLLLLLCRASVFAWRFLVGAAPSSRCWSDGFAPRRGGIRRR